MVGCGLGSLLSLALSSLSSGTSSGGREGMEEPPLFHASLHLLPRIESSLKCMGSNFPNSKKINKRRTPWLNHSKGFLIYQLHLNEQSKESQTSDEI